MNQAGLGGSAGIFLPCSKPATDNGVSLLQFSHVKTGTQASVPLASQASHRTPTDLFHEVPIFPRPWCLVMPRMPEWGSSLAIALGQLSMEQLVDSVPTMHGVLGSSSPKCPMQHKSASEWLSIGHTSAAQANLAKPGCHIALAALELRLSCLCFPGSRMKIMHHFS